MLTQALLTLLALSITASAAERVLFTVDGKYKDWGSHGTGPAMYDRAYDVVPDTNSTVDLRAYGYGWNEYGRDSSSEQLFAFMFRFLKPPFQGPDTTRVELFFDVLPDSTQGQSISSWTRLVADYRVAIEGSNGSITKEILYTHSGGSWTSVEGSDLSDVNVALDGIWLEGSVKWSALGESTPLDSPMTSYALRWAVKTSKGKYQDYLPDQGQEPITEHLTRPEPKSPGLLEGE